MLNPTAGINPVDPNLSRVIEETIGVVNDVENRLQALKVGISQALPQLAPALLWREQAIATLASRGLTSPFGIYGAQTGIPPLAGVPTASGVFGAIPPGIVGNPFATGIHPGLLSQTMPFSPMGISAGQFPGVTNPFGIVAPFRLW